MTFGPSFPNKRDFYDLPSLWEIAIFIIGVFPYIWTRRAKIGNFLISKAQMIIPFTGIGIIAILFIAYVRPDAVPYTLTGLASSTVVGFIMGRREKQLRTFLHLPPKKRS